MLHKSLWGATLAAWLVAQAVAPAGRGPTVLTIDPGESRVTILVGKAGMLSFAGHAHEVVAPAVRGRVTFDPMDWPHASVSLEFDAAALRVTGKDEAASDVPAVEKTMLGAQVLDVEHFPTDRLPVPTRVRRDRRRGAGGPDHRRRHDASRKDSPDDDPGSARALTPRAASRPPGPSR